MLERCRAMGGEDCLCKLASYALQHLKMSVLLTKHLKTAVVIQGLKIWNSFEAGRVVFLW